MSKLADLVVRDVIRLIEPILNEMGFELVDIEYLSEHGRWVLRIYVDSEDGITLDDCAGVSNEIGDLIDVNDIFEHEYVLEVSSPGLNRPLKKEKDFLKAVGKKVKVKMINPVKERRNFTGYLKAFQDGMLDIEVRNELISLPLRDVKKANLVYEFEN
ncbi:MAG: ribosome maturation factor RimP [Desulfobacteraceae bacterium]|nr:MAG: ribosome maturation factor RimP [Desulfobacteraceae bacterium]